MMKLSQIVVVLASLVWGFAPVLFAQNETREEMLEWISQLDKQDNVLVEHMEDAYGTGLREGTAERLNVWNTDVLRKVAEWKIAHLEDESKKEQVRKALQDTLKNIDAVWADSGSGSGSSVFSGSEVIVLIQNQINIWLLPDDEYDAWMDWANVKLDYQGRVVQLKSGMAVVELRNGEVMEFSLQTGNCFVIDGERYALVEKDFVASPCDDHYRVYLYRLEPDGTTTLIEEVVREHFAFDMNLEKEADGCLRVNWREPSLPGRVNSTWIWLLK